MLVCLLLAAGAATAGAETPQPDLPKASVQFDGQTMWLAYAASNDAMTLMEFIPDGQTLEDWTHLAAIHTYHNAQTGPRKRADALAAQIRKTYPEAPVTSLDGPDSRQSVVAFALWSANEPFVEFTVFAFGAGSDGTDVGLQYSIRRKCAPEVFLQRDFEPLRDRLVKSILREGMRIAKDSDLTLVRLALSSSEQSICDTLLKDEVAGLRAVLAQADERSALLLFVASTVAFNTERLEDSAFLFYCGQLRLRFDEQCFPPKTTDEHNPVHLMRSYATELGARINPAVMAEPRTFSKALTRVAEWRPRAPDAYIPGYEFDKRLPEKDAQAAAEPNRVDFLKHMGDFATLLNDEDYFAASRVVKNLRVPGEDRLPTKEEYAAAKATMSRIETEKGVASFSSD